MRFGTLKQMGYPTRETLIAAGIDPAEFGRAAIASMQTEMARPKWWQFWRKK